MFSVIISNGIDYIRVVFAHSEEVVYCHLVVYSFLCCSECQFPPTGVSLAHSLSLSDVFEMG